MTQKNQNHSPQSNAEVINQKVVPSKDKTADTQNLSEKIEVLEKWQKNQNGSQNLSEEFGGLI